MSATSTASAMPNSSVPGGSATQSGPPYLCPTCQTTYSRLEYLRRHERRHADIRPFVCDCGKGFSRSDVLSRHKRQCAVHLNGGSTEGGDTSIASSNGGSSNARANNGVGRRSSSGRQNSRKSSANGTANARSNGRKSAAMVSGERSDSLQNTPDDDEDSPPVNQQQQSQPPHHLPMSFPVASQPHSNMTNVGNSFPFPPQPGVQLGTSAPPPLLPPAPYGTDANGMILQNVSNTNQSFPGIMPPHLSNFNNLVNPQHHYPSSPESNGTMSQHSSPRFSARDMARHGSNGSRFSLRKGGSFDHIGPRSGVVGGGMTGTTPNQYAPEFWDALDPAAKGNANDYVSASGSGQAPLSLADNASGIPLSASGGFNGVTTPRGEPQRFAVSTGPLSPFSSIALSSTMSPYLSAFSNARDTPFVASPSRGVIPGTPGASLNVFDWTMRPPSKPASSSMSKRDSISQQGQPGTAIEKSQSSQGGANEAKRGSSPSPNAAAAAVGTDGKRKREDDEEGRKMVKLEDEAGMEAKKEEIDTNGEDLEREEKEPSHDEDQRSAAELLDSLRNAGSRSSQATFSDAGNASVTSASSDQQVAPLPTSIGESASAMPVPAPVSAQSSTEVQVPSSTATTATSVTTTS